MFLRYAILLFAITTTLGSIGQVNFKTVVPQRPIAVGESIQVQYVVENGEEITNFSTPLYPGFRYVTGPNVYAGNSQLIRYKNMVVTLVPVKTGRFVIRGASCTINGTHFTSNDAEVEIISQKEAEELRKRNEAAKDDVPFFLAPGEDPMEKIRKNLFLKLVLDKRICQVGEPIVATFKLYSRLQSVSDIRKNPGFYGFGVSDMINVNDKIQATEKIDGHLFDVHTIRKVQLYPLQAGTFTIDPMELSNKVEFSRSEVNRQTEQEVLENMYGKDETDKKPSPGTEVFEMDIKTEPAAVVVKPLPAKNMADTFAGAVGNFSISSYIEKDSLLRNEQTHLIITIKGAGNFQSIGAPTVQWPSKLDAFDPTIVDSQDRQQVPLQGYRSFKYAFVSDTPGQYTIPPAVFTFFNPATKSYKTISTSAMNIIVGTASKAPAALNNDKMLAVTHPFSSWWMIAAAALAIAILVGLKLNRDRKAREEALKRKQAEGKPALPGIDELLQPARENMHTADKQFYRELSHAIWNFFQQRLQLTSSRINKSSLANIFESLGIKTSVADEIVGILQQCEAGLYTDAELGTNRIELYEKTRSVLQNAERALSV